jgi:enterochelin esterase-like enzyme
MSFEVEFISLKGMLFSRYLKRKVRIRWVAPPSYREGKSEYPVLLMNDGQDYTAMGLEKTISACYHSKLLRPFVYVGIETTVHRMQEYGTSFTADFKGRGKRAREYSRFVVEELIPFLKEEFRLSPNQEDWVMCGMSLGGLSALDVVLNHPGLFGKAGAFSGSFWWRKAPYVKNDRHDRSRISLDVIKNCPDAPHLKFWFQCGTLDETADRNHNGVIDSIDDTKDVIRELERKGYDPAIAITYVQVEGGRHDLQTWARVFPDFLQWAFKKG